MNSQQDFLIDPIKIVRELVNLPHRGTTTAEERKAADILQGHLERLGATVERQRFRTSKTYISEVWWLLSILVLGLILIPYIPWIALGLVALSVVTSLLYFDWRPTPVSFLPPRGESANVIGRIIQTADPDKTSHTGPSKNKLILMAHYDSAPVSILYLPSMVKNFRRSLLISLGLMVVAFITALIEILGYGQPVVTWLRWAFVVYFPGQGVMSTIDYLRFGFTKGAADNATGAAAAIATAERLWRAPIPGWEVTAVLTGAEEAGLVGSRKYLKEHREELAPDTSFVLNFDNIGSGDLKIITRTGNITNVVYDNQLVRSALETAEADSLFNRIGPGVWHTGDFDSIWFMRAGIPSLTLSAQDNDGQIPNLHRPGDTVENVDASLLPIAVEFAEATIRRLAQSM